ncbi:UNVERIFIED_CONTAM: hypothetical protein FKN15_020838 [Acipenser sinensis]
MRSTVWVWRRHSDGCGPLLEKRSAAKFTTPGMCIALRDSRLAWAHSNSLKAMRCNPGDRRPPWWLIYTTTVVLSAHVHRSALGESAGDPGTLAGEICCHHLAIQYYSHLHPSAQVRGNPPPA